GYRRTLAEILAHIAVVTTRVQRCDHRLAVGPFPKAYVEWDARRGVFGGVGAADPGSRTPCQFLCREPFNSDMCQDAGQGRGKTEAVRKHVLDTGLAELVAKPIVAVQDLTGDGLGTGRVDVALLHGRAGRKPATGRHILFEPRKVSRIVFLHHAVPIGAAEIEDVVRILFEQREVVTRGLGEVFADDLRILPSPLRIEM